MKKKINCLAGLDISRFESDWASMMRKCQLECWNSASTSLYVDNSCCWHNKTVCNWYLTGYWLWYSLGYIWLKNSLNFKVYCILEKAWMLLESNSSRLKNQQKLKCFQKKKKKSIWKMPFHSCRGYSIRRGTRFSMYQQKNLLGSSCSEEVHLLNAGERLFRFTETNQNDDFWLLSFLFDCYKWIIYEEEQVLRQIKWKANAKRWLEG